MFNHYWPCFIYIQLFRWIAGIDWPEFPASISAYKVDDLPKLVATVEVMQGESLEISKWRMVTQPSAFFGAKTAFAVSSSLMKPRSRPSYTERISQQCNTGNDAHYDVLNAGV